MAILLGLHGRRGAGKDAAFSYIQKWGRERGITASRRGFADQLKWSFARLFTPDCSVEEAVILCDRLKENGTLTLREDVSLEDQQQSFQQIISGRVALQRYGTEAHREVFGEDFWIDALFPDDDWQSRFFPPIGVLAQPQICVVTDVRYENEAKRIKELGGEVWWIDRWQPVSDAHASERLLPMSLIDIVIGNNSTLEELERKIRLQVEGRFLPELEDYGGGVELELE